MVQATTNIIALVIAILASTVLAVYLYFKLNPWAQVDRNTILVEETAFPVPGNKRLRSSELKMNSMNNEAAVSFWVYVKNFRDTQSNLRHIFHTQVNDRTIDINDANGTSIFTKISSHAFFDPKDNAMYVHFASRGGTLFDGKTLNTFTERWNYMVHTRGIKINYVPENRWVFVTVTYKKQGKSGVLNGYLDGELVATKTSQSKPEFSDFSNLSTYPRQLGDVAIPGPGNVTYVGLDKGVSGFTGLVSSIRFHEWQPTLTEIRKIYRNGPIDNVLARMGLPAFRTQQPIYEVDTLAHDYGKIDAQK